MVVDLNAEVAARDHHRISGLHNLREISQAALVFYLRNDAGLGAETVEQRAKLEDVLTFADKRQSHKINPCRNADADVALILFRQSGKIHIHARQIDMPAGPESSRSHHAASHMGRVFLEDFETDESAIHQHGRADGHIVSQSRIIHVHSTNSFGRRRCVKLKRIAGLQLERFSHYAGANLRPFHIHHHGDMPLHIVRNFPNTLHQRRDPFASPMRHVQPNHVHAADDQLPKPLVAFRGRPDGRNDFCLPVITSHILVVRKLLVHRP